MSKMIAGLSTMIATSTFRCCTPLSAARNVEVAIIVLSPAIIFDIHTVNIDGYDRETNFNPFAGVGLWDFGQHRVIEPRAPAGLLQRESKDHPGILAEVHRLA